MLYLKLLVLGLRSLLMPSATLRIENLALRQQLAVLKQQSRTMVRDESVHRQPFRSELIELG